MRNTSEIYLIVFAALIIRFQAPGTAAFFVLGPLYKLVFHLFGALA